MARKWEILEQKYDDFVKQLLYNRGIKTEKEAEDFFDPKLENYKKDLDLPGIDKAKKRILEAIKNEELIIVYGDYDADGLCASAVAYLGLTSIGAKVLPYIPHRENEGYGMSETGLKYCQEKGAKLIITVDNGIVDIKEAQLAKELGFDLVITDHHTPQETLPEAISIIHSTKMCGAAVAWCLIRELVEGKKSEELLDLVALATVCDMMPLLGVNRALAKKGLEKLNSTKNIGLLALIDLAKLTKGKITTYHLGNVIGPRLNAKGRLDSAMDALRLLCTKDPQKARQLARVLEDANCQRKQIVDDGLVLAKQMIGDNKKKVIVLQSNKWMMGIVGLIAGKVREEYKVPTIIISQGETFSRASCRSVPGVNLLEKVRSCSEFLVTVGGHPQSLGFDIETEKIDLFRQKLEEVMESQEITEGGDLMVEAVVEPSKITKKLINELAKFEPCGLGNPKPLLASFGLRATDVRTVGNGSLHLKFKADGIEAIAFSFGALIENMKEGKLVDLAYNLELDSFNGNEKIQMKVQDIKLTD